MTRDGVNLPHGLTVFSADSMPFSSDALKYEKEDDYNLNEDGDQEDPEAA